MESFRKNLLISQAWFYGGCLVCIALAPTSLSANTGLSYFGVHKLTIIPFGAGIILAAYYLLRALTYLPNKSNLKPLSFGLRLMTPLMVGIVLTPYSIDKWFDWLHTALGSTLFSLELLVAFWVIAKIKNDITNWLLVTLQTAGGVISLIYLAPTQGFLLQGQLLFQLAFSGLLLRNFMQPEATSA